MQGISQPVQREAKARCSSQHNREQDCQSKIIDPVEAVQMLSEHGIFIEGVS